MKFVRLSPIPRRVAEQKAAAASTFAAHADSAIRLRARCSRRTSRRNINYYGRAARSNAELFHRIRPRMHAQYGPPNSPRRSRARARRSSSSVVVAVELHVELGGVAADGAAAADGGGSPARATPSRSEGELDRVLGGVDVEAARLSGTDGPAPKAAGGATRRRAAAAKRTEQRRQPPPRSSAASTVRPGAAPSSATRRRPVRAVAVERACSVGAAGCVHSTGGSASAAGAPLDAASAAGVDREGRLLHGVGALLEAVLALFSLPFVMSASSLPRDLPPDLAAGGGRRRATAFARARRGGGTGVAARRAGVREREAWRAVGAVFARGRTRGRQPLPLPARCRGGTCAVFSSCAISAGPRAHMARRLCFWLKGRPTDSDENSARSLRAERK